MWAMFRVGSEGYPGYGRRIGDAPPYQHGLSALRAAHVAARPVNRIAGTRAPAGTGPGATADH